MVPTGVTVTVNGLEAVADAIMSFEGWKPGTRSYVNRNPGNLEGGSKVDAKNYDVFPSLIDGYSALLRELRDKFIGNNRHGIGPESSLLDLFNVYAPPSDNNPTNQYCAFVAHWVSMVLGTVVVSETKLKDIWHA